MKHVLLVGGGKIGEMIASLLCATGDYRVTLADRSAAQLQKVPALPHLQTLELDATNEAALIQAMVGKFAVLSAAPFDITGTIARAAKNAGLHYLDLTEDVAATRLIKSLATDASHALFPNAAWRRASS